MKSRFAPVSLACLLLCAAGCTPQAPAASTPTAEDRKPPSGIAAAAPVPAETPVPAPAPVAARPLDPAPPPVVRPFDESLLRGREFLLESVSARPYVHDSDLGALGMDPAVTRVAETFFRDAAAGKLEDAALVPRWAAYLRGWAQRYQKMGNAAKKMVRVGAGIPGEDGILLVPVRVTGGASPLQGWLALVRDGETWLVSDVQVIETAARTGPFDPESPPQEISSPSLR